MPRVGEEVRVYVGRQHGGVAVYMAATVERLTGRGFEARLHTSAAHVKVLDLVDVPPLVSDALRERPKAPRLALAATDAEESPPLWRLSEFPRRRA